jgi:hypothetical protein
MRPTSGSKPFVREVLGELFSDDQTFSRGFRAERCPKNPTGYGACRNPLVSLVAGVGFEPTTFGL